jgi:hypothetical protein
MDALGFQFGCQSPTDAPQIIYRGLEEMSQIVRFRRVGYGQDTGDVRILLGPMIGKFG